MQIRARLAAPALVMAAGLLLAGCNDNSGSSGTAAAPAGGSTTGGSTAASSTSGGSSGGSSSGSSSGGSSSTSGGSTSGGSAAGPAKCRTADLGFSYGPDSGAQAVGEQGGINVNLTSRGSADCYLYGYPGVDLSGTVNGKAYTWSLTRGGKAKPAKVVLKPGGVAHFWITYLPDTGTGGNEVIKVRKIVITPPDETHQAALTWDYQDVTLQDGATHPGTYVAAVEPGNNS